MGVLLTFNYFLSYKLCRHRQGELRKAHHPVHHPYCCYSSWHPWCPRGGCHYRAVDPPRVEPWRRSLSSLSDVCPRGLNDLLKWHQAFHAVPVRWSYLFLSRVLLFPGRLSCPLPYCMSPRTRDKAQQWQQNKNKISADSPAVGVSDMVSSSP